MGIHDITNLDAILAAQIAVRSCVAVYRIQDVAIFDTILQVQMTQSRGTAFGKIHGTTNFDAHAVKLTAKFNSTAFRQSVHVAVFNADVGVQMTPRRCAAFRLRYCTAFVCADRAA
jgi:hypothetical protein